MVGLSLWSIVSIMICHIVPCSVGSESGITLHAWCGELMAEMLVVFADSALHAACC